MSIIIKMPEFAYYNTLFQFKKLSVPDRDIILYNYKNNTHIQRKYVSSKYIQTKFNNTPYKTDLLTNYKKHYAMHVRMQTDKSYIRHLYIHGISLSYAIHVSFEYGMLYNICISIIFMLAYLIDGVYYKKK